MATILLKRGLESGIPTLAVGEPGFTTDTFKLFIGSSSGNQLIGPSSGGVSDGDKGDVTVSSSGTVWTIDAGVVTFAKMQDISTARLLGRSTAGTGSVEQIEIGSGLSLSGGILSATGGVSDGDKGDVAVSGSGATWTIDNGVVTFAKMQDISTNRLLGRSTASTGSVEQITIGSGLSLSGGTLSATGGGISFATLYKWGF